MNGVDLTNTSIPGFSDIRSQLIALVKNARYSPETEFIITVMFALLIAIGALGNGLVCLVVIRNPAMRTARNIFIINLAISDLSLCLFTQVFNFLKMRSRAWPYGLFLCKFVPMFAGTNVFVSTISITAIALDRFQVIVYPTRDSVRKIGTCVCLLTVWTISMLMAGPLVVFYDLFEVVIPTHLYKLYDALQINESGLLFNMTVCTEKEEYEKERSAYSICSMIVQYILPILIVSTAHARICFKLKYRMVVQTSSGIARNRRNLQMKRRTNTLLVAIALVFALAWLPLNVVNVLMDIPATLLWLSNHDKSLLTVTCCHLCVLSSACTNPILYGWLNENFRREFVKLLGAPIRHIGRKRAQLVENVTMNGMASDAARITTHVTVPQKQENSEEKSV